MGVKVLEAMPLWHLEVTKFKKPGYTWVDKFGSNTDVDTASTPETLWEYGGVYPWGNDTGDDLYISSSDDGDTQDVELLIQTIDVNGNWNESTVTKTLVGQTPVLVSADVVRCQRMENDSDFGDDFAGEVYAYYDNTDVILGVPQTASNVLSYVNNGANQTKQLVYTIPTGYVGFLFRGEAGISKAANQPNEGDFAYRSRRFGKVFKEKKDFAVMTTGSNNYVDVRVFPDPIPAKTDLEMRVINVTANDMSAWGTFDILLIDEDVLEAERPGYLDLIGQIKRVT